MKSKIMMLGVLLILIGVVTFAYQRFTYTQREEVAKIGTLQVTADTQKTVYFPPMLSGISILAGIVLVVLGRKNSD